MRDDTNVSSLLLNEIAKEIEEEQSGSSRLVMAQKSNELTVIEPPHLHSFSLNITNV
jgi:hypothetical protein